MPCTHLDHILITELPEETDGCEDCLATGGKWLHLRICLECGKVGCCDDSPNRHATAHATRERAPDHPLDRARRRVVVVLHRRGDDEHPRGARRDPDPAVTAGRVKRIERQFLALLR